jgi:hypothetical protein
MEARREISAWLRAELQKEDEGTKSYYEVNGIRFIKLEAARPIFERILEEHKELFQKLAE